MLPTPIIMGIVNVTPDSFSDGGQFHDAERAIEHGLKLLEDGADVLDIGGESTRPGANIVSANQELSRVIPVIEGLCARADTRISIDTRKPIIAKAAMAAGASIWNDVSALTYAPESLAVAAALDVQIVLMHAQGRPETMQDNPAYTDVVAEVCGYLLARREAAEAAGVRAQKLILDPGIGFGKTLAHNLQLLAKIEQICALGSQVLLGTSRKRFIAALDRENDAQNRLGGSIATAVMAYTQGVQWFRVHDVAQTRQALAVAKAVSLTS